MKLKIDHFKQEKKNSCGLASLRSLISAYQKPPSEFELAKHVKLHSFGSLITDLGLIALNCNFPVTIYCLHLSLLAPLCHPFGTQINKEKLKKIKARPSDNLILQSMKKFVTRGGKLVWDYPRISFLKQILRQKHPCLISINTAALGNFHKHWDNGHYLLVNGIDGSNNLSIIDPYYEKNKAYFQLKQELLLPSWSINATRSSGFLLVLK